MSELKKLDKETSKITLVELPPTQFGRLNGEPCKEIFDVFSFPPRALPTLEAILKAEGWKDVQSISPRFHGEKGKFSKKNEERISTSDVVGVSSLTRTSPQSKELIRQYKLRKPEGIGIAGGMDPTCNPSEWIENQTDIVVVGEGEGTIKAVMERLTQDPGSLEDIAGIVCNENGNPRPTFHRKFLTPEELGELPHPIYDESIRTSRYSMPVIETSRGCPYGCDFCSIHLSFGNKTRNKPIDYVIEGMERMQGWACAPFIPDDNFTANRGHAKKLLKEMTRRGLYKRGISAQVSVATANDQELLDELMRAGVNFLYVGVESIHDDILDDLGKPFTAQQTMDAVVKLRRQGFWVNGFIIVGSDKDTPAKAKETLRWANANLDGVQFLPLTPFPGTSFYEKLGAEGRILSRDWSLYNGQTVLINPENFSPYELQRTVDKMNESFYSVGQSAKRMFHTSEPRVVAWLCYYNHFRKGLRDGLHNPQAQEHLEFLKSIS